MKVSNTLHVGVCVALLFGTQPARADEIFEFVDLQECRVPVKETDPTLLIETILSKEAQCGDGIGGNKIIVDQWFGVEWPTKQSGGKPRAIAERVDPLETGTHKACILPRSRAKTIYLWVVPRSDDCMPRDNLKFAREIRDGLICFKLKGDCMPASELNPDAYHLVHQVIQKALRKRRSELAATRH